MSLNKGDKVRFLGYGFGENTSHAPRIGTVGIVSDPDATGAVIDWPKGSVPRFGDRSYISEEFLEIVKEAENMEPKTCACCGAIIEEDQETYYVEGVGDVCEDCVSNYYMCSCCNELHDADDIEEVDDDWVCTDCLERNSRYYRCEHCGEWHDSRYGMDYYSIWNGDVICESCRDDYYTECYDCGELHDTDDMIWDEDEEVYRCPDCDRRHNRHVHNYSYKPSPIFKTGPTIHDVFYSSHDVKDLLFGVELEIDKGDDAESVAEDLSESSEDIYCKHDGSLTDSGVEIVTHPCTLNYHLHDLGWSNITRIARDHDYLSHEARTCGLHVHVGREQFSENEDVRMEVAAKLVMLVDRHWDNIVKFSRRKEGQLRWAERPNMNYEGDAKHLVENALETKRGGRYQAVNLCNYNTVEFRIFNGTLKTETIFATLQFVSNMCKYAMTHSVEDVMSSQWDDIINVEQFETLKKYVEERGIMAEKLEAIKSKPYKELKRGDIVIVTGQSRDGYQLLDDLRGHVGIYLGVTGFFSDEDAAILFNEPISAPGRGATHDCHGRLRDGVGYFIERCDFEPIPEELLTDAEKAWASPWMDYQLGETDFDPRTMTNVNAPEEEYQPF